MPDCRIASTLKAHHTELPTPTSTADSRSGRDFGQKNHVMLSCGRRARRSSAAGAWNTARAPTTTAIATKTTHATRHCAPATIAIGPAMATPHPVPELIVDHTTSRFSGMHLARDDVGVRRERHAGCGTGNDDPDGNEHHRVRACDDTHPDRGEECGSSDGHARAPPGEHSDHTDVGRHVGEVGSRRDQAGGARGHLDLGTHVGEQQAVAVAGEAERDRDHRGARQQGAGRRRRRRDERSRSQTCASSAGTVCWSGHARPPELHASRSQSRQVCRAGCLAVVRLETSRSSSCSSSCRSAAVSTSRDEASVSWRSLHRGRGTTPSRSRQAKSTFARVRRSHARHQTRTDQAVDEPRRTRARQPQDVAEPGDRAVRMGQQGHQRRMVGRGQTMGVGLVDQAVGDGQRERTNEVLQAAHATIVQYLTDAGK